MATLTEPAVAADASGPRSRPWPTIQTAVGGAFMAWAFTIGAGRLVDNSFFTHLATGRMLIDGSFPRVDSYSYTAAGEPWVVQSWLASLGLGWVESWWGGGGVRVAVGLVCALIAALVWQLTRSAEGLGSRILITALVVAVGTTFWAPRPLLVGFVGLLVLLLAAEGRVWPPLLVPVMWVWANSHGSYPLGVLAVAALALGRRLDGEKPTEELRALAWAAAGVATAFIGPLGLRVWTFPVELLSRQGVLRNIIEWQSPDFANLWARVFLLQVVVAVLLLVRRPSYRAAVPLVIFLGAALLGARNIPIASLVLIPGMAYGARGLGSVRGEESGPVAKVALVAVVAGGLLLGTVTIDAPDYDLREYPIDALAFAGERGWLQGDVRVLTEETSGNLLELVSPATPVFIDDRLDMFPDGVVDDFLVLRNGRPGWRSVLDAHEIDVVVWSRELALGQLLAVDPDWHLGYGDDRFIVACRRATACPTGA